MQIQKKTQDKHYLHVIFCHDTIIFTALQDHSYTSILNQNKGAVILVKTNHKLKNAPRLLRFIYLVEKSCKTEPSYKVFYFDRFICIYKTFYVWLPYLKRM